MQHFRKLLEGFNNSNGNLLNRKSVATFKRSHTEPPVSEPRISQGHVIKRSYGIIGRSYQGKSSFCQVWLS